MVMLDAARVVETGDPTVRVPPHSIEAEQALLGAVLVDPGAWSAVRHLAASDFYRSDHRAVYSGLASLLEEGETVDVVTVAIRLERDGPDVGGLAFLAELTQATAEPENAGAYAGIVRERSRLRALAAIGADMSSQALAGGASAGAIVAQARSMLDALPATPAAGLPTMAIGDLLDRPDDATEWLVDGILPAGGFSVFSGKPKAGKSTAARHLAHAVASGERWLDRGTAAGPVVYIALEEKVSEVRRHFMAMGTPRGAPLRICFHRTPGDAVALLAETVAEFNPVLVIVDTLFRFQPVGDTSSYGDVLKALAPLQSLARDSGAHILAVHHERKSGADDRGDRVLGSTAIFGTVDVMLSIERRHADDVRVISSTGRYGDDLTDTVITLRPDGSVALAGSVDEIRTKQSRAAMLAFLTENPGLSQSEIKATCEMRWQDVHAALKLLVHDGSIVQHGTGKRGDARRHFVADSCSRSNGAQSDDDCSRLPKGREQSFITVPGTVTEQREQQSISPPGKRPGETAGEAYRRAKEGTP